MIREQNDQRIAATTEQIIKVGRRLRAHLTTSEQVAKPRAHRLSQLLWGSEVIHIAKLEQEAIDQIFNDFNALTAAAVTYWLDRTDNPTLLHDVVKVLSKLNIKYFSKRQHDTQSKASDAVLEICDVTDDIRKYGQAAAERWLQINKLPNDFLHNLDSTTVLVAPLTTDYFVAMLHLRQLAEAEQTPIVFPVAWVPDLYDPVLPSQATEHLDQESVKYISVMVDTFVSGETGFGVKTALQRMFPNKEVYAR